MDSILEASDMASERLIREGILQFSDEMKDAIKPLKGIWCGCGLLGVPPFGAMYQCVDEACDTWIHTEKDYPCHGCEDCGILHGMTRKTDRNVAASSSKKSVAGHHRDQDMAIYGYGRHNGGCSIMEKGRHECADLADMEIRMNELRAEPSECTRALPCEFSERVIGYGPRLCFGEDGLCLEDGMLEFTGEQTALSDEALERLEKDLRKGVYPPPEFDLEELSESAKSTLYLAGYKRLLELCVFCAGDNYINEPTMAVTVVELETKHSLRRHMYPSSQLKILLTACLGDITKRLRKKARQPFSSQLYGFEAKRPKGLQCIGLVPHLGSEEVLRAVHAPKAEALEEVALERMQKGGLRKDDKEQAGVCEDATQSCY